MKKFYIHNGTEQMGPFDVDELKARDIHSDTPIWHEGLENWTTASQVEELKNILKNSSPPPFTQQTSSPPPIPKIETHNEDKKPIIDLSGLSSYWVGEFTKIHESKEIYKGKWNSWPFLFGFFWLIWKGAWLYGSIYIILSLIVVRIENEFFGIVAALVLGLYFGFKGNWIYYNVKIKNRQI
jgi:hypothetical protein